MSSPNPPAQTAIVQPKKARASRQSDLAAVPKAAVAQSLAVDDKNKPLAKTRASHRTKGAGKSATVPTPALDQVAAEDQVKSRKKLVRDSFTMPRQDFDLIEVLKQRALEFKRPAKKSELLRAGLQALAALPPAKLKHCLDQLVELKTGRPRKSG